MTLFKTGSCDEMMFKDIETLLYESCSEFDSRNLAKLPSARDLNNEFKETNQNNKKLIFISQDKDLPFLELGYEERIFKHGIIAHRENNWHDFFNAMIWKKYPRTKNILNSLHFHELQNQTSKLRSKKRDILTLFDECGVLIQADDNILKQIRNHQWSPLFIDNKQLWQNKEIEVNTFGHAMYEKYLSPYIGMTAKALLLPKKIKNMDEYLKDKIAKNDLLSTKSDLHPLPILGIPNWYDKQSAEFYANKSYFR